MNSFEILDHPADIGIKVKGETLEKLFINAALGTTFLITEVKDIEYTKIKKKIDFSCKNLTELFTKWLDEVIYFFDSEGFIIRNIKLDSLNDSSLHATLEGEKLNTQKHKVKLYLKAVTYHQLEIKKDKKDNWEAVVYFDV